MTEPRPDALRTQASKELTGISTAGIEVVGIKGHHESDDVEVGSAEEATLMAELQTQLVEQVMTFNRAVSVPFTLFC